MKTKIGRFWLALGAMFPIHGYWIARADEQPMQHSTPSSVEVIAINTNDLPTLPYDAGMIKFIATSEKTGGRSAVVELTEMPGYKTAWHRHDNCEESFYVLEGVLTIKIADRTRVYPAGSFVLIPRGTPHGQGNFSQAPVKLLTTFTPGGFDAFFVDRVELFKQAKPGNAEFERRFDALRTKHGQWVQILGAWEPGK